MDNITNKNVNVIEQTMNFFNEFHPNPIIGLDLTYKVTYLNLSARTKFPAIETVGINHPILQALVEELKKMKLDGKELVVFCQDIDYLESSYEQQIFLIPNLNMIFIFMNEISDVTS